MSLQDVKDHLVAYDNITPERLRQNLVDFLERVASVAQDLVIRLCCHPDDPPFPLMGLPRIMSTEADYAAIMKAIDVPANGITLCSGSLSVRGDSDLPGMMRRWGDWVHFIHLRNIRRDSSTVPCSFHESVHIDGDVDMVPLIREILAEEARRRASGRADHNIAFRPDHGLHMTDDNARGGLPGYPLVGRQVGLAELRGIVTALETSAP